MDCHPLGQPSTQLSMVLKPTVQGQLVGDTTHTVFGHSTSSHKCTCAYFRHLPPPPLFGDLLTTLARPSICGRSHCTWESSLLLAMCFVGNAQGRRSRGKQTDVENPHDHTLRFEPHVQGHTKTPPVNRFSGHQIRKHSFRRAFTDVVGFVSPL